MAALLLLLLPALAMARIEVEISGRFDGPDQSNMAVYFSGSDVGIISDEERNSFGLKDKALKEAVRSYFGSRPDDVYLRSPTPWGDLYQSYGWDQVLRTLVPKSGRILKITSEPMIVHEQIFENNSSKPAVFNVGIHQSVENSVSSSWFKGGDLSVGQKISYDVDIDFMTAGDSTSMSYTSSWGEKSEKTEAVTVGASSAMEVTLQPNQSVLAQLQATRGTMRVEIEYEASLSGAAAVNYNEAYRGHHFWSLDVRAVMNAGNMENRLRSKQIIDISFFSNAKVMVHDRNMHQKLMEVNF